MNSLIKLILFLTFGAHIMFHPCIDSKFRCFSILSMHFIAYKVVTFSSYVRFLVCTKKRFLALRHTALSRRISPISLQKSLVRARSFTYRHPLPFLFGSGAYHIRLPLVSRRKIVSCFSYLSNCEHLLTKKLLDRLVTLFISKEAFPSLTSHEGDTR